MFVRRDVANPDQRADAISFQDRGTEPLLHGPAADAVHTGISGDRQPFRRRIGVSPPGVHPGAGRKPPIGLVRVAAILSHRLGQQSSTSLQQPQGDLEVLPRCAHALLLLDSGLREAVGRRRHPPGRLRILRSWRDRLAESLPLRAPLGVRTRPVSRVLVARGQTGVLRSIRYRRVGRGFIATKTSPGIAAVVARTIPAMTREPLAATHTAPKEDRPHRPTTAFRIRACDFKRSTKATPSAIDRRTTLPPFHRCQNRSCDGLRRPVIVLISARASCPSIATATSTGRPRRSTEAPASSIAAMMSFWFASIR